MAAIANINEPFPLRILAADGRADLFAEVRVYNSSGLQVGAFSAAHIAEGLYGATWTPNLEGFFTLIGQFYYDNLHTLEAAYEKVADGVEVSSLKANVLRMLGLQHENAVVDNQAYNVDGRLISARVRTYDSKANAEAASVAGLVATYSIAADYDLQGRVSQYSMVRES